MRRVLNFTNWISNKHKKVVMLQDKIYGFSRAQKSLINNLDILEKLGADTPNKILDSIQKDIDFIGVIDKIIHSTNIKDNE
jgi:hypothetical protein